MKVRLAPFEHEALKAYRSSHQAPPGRVVRTAVLYYLREQDSNRSTWPMPQMGREEPESGVEVRVHLGEETERALARQAGAQGVHPRALARHALLFFLADVDSGRVAAALARDLGAD